eukprot:jgi/Tetstr1/464181/TSEL_008986.t1
MSLSAVGDLSGRIAELCVDDFKEVYNAARRENRRPHLLLRDFQNRLTHETKAALKSRERREVRYRRACSKVDGLRRRIEEAMRAALLASAIPPRRREAAAARLPHPEVLFGEIVADCAREAWKNSSLLYHGGGEDRRASSLAKLHVKLREVVEANVRACVPVDEFCYSEDEDSRSEGESSTGGESESDSDSEGESDSDSEGEGERDSDSEGEGEGESEEEEERGVESETESEEEGPRDTGVPYKGEERRVESETESEDEEEGPRDTGVPYKGEERGGEGDGHPDGGETHLDHPDEDHPDEDHPDEGESGEGESGDGEGESGDGEGEGKSGEGEGESGEGEGESGDGEGEGESGEGETHLDPPDEDHPDEGESGEREGESEEGEGHPEYGGPVEEGRGDTESFDDQDEVEVSPDDEEGSFDKVALGDAGVSIGVSIGDEAEAVSPDKYVPPQFKVIDTNDSRAQPAKKIMLTIEKTATA